MAKETQLLIALDAPPPDSSTLDNDGNGAPYFKGEGSLDLACSNCKTVLAEGVERGSIRDLTLRCKCGKYCLVS